jgi:hypothetical protein
VRLPSSALRRWRSYAHPFASNAARVFRNRAREFRLLVPRVHSRIHHSLDTMYAMSTRTSTATTMTSSAR